MNADKALKPSVAGGIGKCSTGVCGLDELTGAGLPRERPTLISGGAGCGKALLAMEFLGRGSPEFDQPGLFESFEEGAQDLIQNFDSMGFDLAAMEKAKQFRLMHVDLLDRPALVEGDQILAVPTLGRKLTAPLRKIIGDLSDTEKVLVGLDVRPACVQGAGGVG